MTEGFNYVPADVTQTSSAVHSDIKNPGYKGVVFMIDVDSHDSASGDESYVFNVQGKDGLSGSYYTLLSSVNVRTGGGDGLYVLEVHPALTEAANTKASRLLPDVVRVSVTVGGTTPTIDYTIRGYFV